MQWQRPDCVPFPSVWHRFKAMAGTGDQMGYYVVQDLPSDRVEETFDLLAEPFTRDEVMNRTNRLIEDPLGVEMVREMWQQLIPGKMSLICVEEATGQIVGVNVLGVVSKSDNEPDFKYASSTFQTIYDLNTYVAKQANVFDRHGVDHYLSAMGLSVDPRYRRRGIATEILRARVPLCKAVGLTLTANCFSGVASQIAATKAGFREDVSYHCGSLVNVDERFALPGIENECFKYMSLKIE
ncbi:uncharacterized protein LOC129754966 [Uranotaenia lowii]|uniref:uncharacterized protein LOC129754966 n=1 Tax=Uranotaenia lowii TaxID=190385 RepID=UPI00247B1813|nr:uncharacterized protein LOC129754966 [Uranotaenia lowii]